MTACRSVIKRPYSRSKDQKKSSALLVGIAELFEALSIVEKDASDWSSYGFHASVSRYFDQRMVDAIVKCRNAVHQPRLNQLRHGKYSKEATIAGAENGIVNLLWDMSLSRRDKLRWLYFNDNMIRGLLRSQDIASYWLSARELSYRRDALGSRNFQPAISKLCTNPGVVA